MSLNISYIKILSAITIVFTCINYSNSAPVTIEQYNSAIQQNAEQVKTKESTNNSQLKRRNAIRFNQENTNNQQIQLNANNDMNPAPISTNQNQSSNTQLKLKNDTIFDRENTNNQQIQSNANNNMNPAPISTTQNQSSNQQILLNKTQQNNTSLPLGHKDYMPEPEDNINQFIEESSKILEKINTNKQKIQDAFDKSLKQKGQETKAILQILLGNYTNLYYIILTTKKLVNQYNYGIPNKDDNEGVYNAIRNGKKIEVINNIQRLEYDKYLINVLQTVVSNYQSIDNKKRYYKEEGWNKEKDFKDFCKFLSGYISDFVTLRAQFIELCNKHLNTLKQQVKEYLSQNQRKQLNNCVSNTIQYITNTIGNILSIMNNQFDTTKMGQNTSELRKILSENKRVLPSIEQSIKELLENESITDEQCTESLNKSIGCYKTYLTNIVKFFYEKYLTTNYKTESCKSKFMFSYFINMLISVTTTFMDIFNDTVLIEYNNYINKIYPNQSTNIGKIVI